MKIVNFFKALIVGYKYNFYYIRYGIPINKFPNIWYCETLKRYIVFCPNCGEYICEDGLCSNPLCPEKIGEWEELLK